MLISAFQRKILKISAYILGSLVVLSLGFHFWFINHAERLLEDMVESRSNGKIKLQVKKFKFNWFSYNMQLVNAVFYSADTGTAATSYRFGVEQLNVRVKEILPLIFEKKILIDSLSLINPDITVTRLRSIESTDTTTTREASLPHEMGKIYNSIQDALQVLQVNRFQINNGRFTLVNKIRPGQLPVTISNIYFHLDNLQVDTSDASGKEKILFSDNVSLRSFNQDIAFPDGRHRLSFGNFHINILKRIIEFDSCTISATRGDSSQSSFSVFFDKLQMTNIDFYTLYKDEVIKADSVYCINPRFRLDVELDKRSDKKRSPPRLDELIQLLTGDMQLGFVVVNNGSFDINTVRDGRPSSFTSDHNNFEMQGLKIQRGAPQPLSVESFAMAIRNYENFLRDSTYAMQFDSILFLNNSVLLSNFSFKQLKNDKVINSFTMPQFELRGLSWDELVFNRKLSADYATLYYPVINYTVASKKRNIFQTLSEIERIIDLQNLDMTRGQINIHFMHGAELKLENADVSLLPQDLLRSDRVSRLQRSVRKLNFKKGTYTSRPVIVEMENASIYGETGKLSAGKIRLRTRAKNLTMDATNVAIERMTFDSRSHISSIDGIRWDAAELDLKTVVNKSAGTDLAITNIRGGNTKLTLSFNEQSVNALLHSISADKILLPSKAKPEVTNLKTAGQDFLFRSQGTLLTIKKYTLNDRQQSQLDNLEFVNNQGRDSIAVSLPLLTFEPDLNQIIRGNIVAGNAMLKRPEIRVQQIHSLGVTGGGPMKLPEVSIDHLKVENPLLTFIQTGDKDLRIDWKGNTEKNNFFELKNLIVKNDPVPVISIDNSGFSVNDIVIGAAGRSFSTGNGSISASFSGIRLQRQTADHWNWNAKVDELQVKDLAADNMGQYAGRLQISSARINDVALHSSSMFNLRQSLKESPAFRLRGVTGSYDNDKSHFDWSNLGFDKYSKTLSVDSFNYRPTPDKESFVASQPYQTDYTILRVGKVEAGPFEIDRYLTDTVIKAGSVNISSMFMTTYRDKRKPERENIVKPLPVNVIKNIPAHLSLDTLNLHNTDIEYTELNDKTNQTGTITINRLKGKIFPLNNYELKSNDSLSLEAEGWLMDSLKISLRVKESYTDSLAGFLLSGSATRADLRVLNPVLVPLISAKLESGFLDTMSMTVTGKEFYAEGEMKMYYHDLKVKMLKGGKDGKKSFMSGIINFIANSFIIKKNNSSRTGVIFFERLRNKSTLNYLVKITLSGVTSNAGIKKSKKDMRRYKKK